MRINELISIIIPIYNVEKYLPECIESIINQSYSNLEILLIDDGSTDNSGKIAKEYEKRDNRIKYYLKENGGLASARNFGIDKSNGIYLMFIDSDDYIENDMVEKLYYSLTQNNASISCCGKYLEYDDETVVINSKGDFYSDKDDALKRIMTKNQIDTSCCDKLFKADLFNNIKFPEGKLFEDLGTLYKIIDLSQGIYHIHYPLYHYRQRRGSILNSNFNVKKLDAVYFRKEIENFINKKYNHLNKYSKCFYYPTLIDYTLMCYIFKLKNEYKSLKREIKKNFFNIIFSNIPFKFKIKSIIILLNLSKAICYLKVRNEMNNNN